MGQVPGEVVAAAFAVFNPEIVIPHVTLGWSRTDAVSICEARDNGAIAQLRRLLGESPDGVERAAGVADSSRDAAEAGGSTFVCRRSLTGDARFGSRCCVADG